MSRSGNMPDSETERRICSSCDDVISTQSEYLTCFCCDSTLHVACREVSNTEAKTISKKNNINFICDECLTRKVHGQADDDLEADDIQSLKAQLQQFIYYICK
jgi:hypothetical protein